ncbi:MAG: hypothetical protein WCK05_08310 [Planctomycetota bacterium]
MTRTCKTIMMAAATVTAAVCFPMTAQAGHGRGGLSIAIGGLFGGPAYGPPAVQQVLVAPGHYEDRAETVLVEAGHWEKVCIPAVERLVYDRHGRARVVTVVPAHKEKTWVPDRFETRIVQVWVPAVYATQPVAGCGAGPVLPAISIGGRFRW